MRQKTPSETCLEQSGGEERRSPFSDIITRILLGRRLQSKMLAIYFFVQGVYANRLGLKCEFVNEKISQLALFSLQFFLYDVILFRGGGAYQNNG